MTVTSTRNRLLDELEKEENKESTGRSDGSFSQVRFKKRG